MGLIQIYQYLQIFINYNYYHNKILKYRSQNRKAHQLAHMKACLTDTVICLSLKLVSVVSVLLSLSMELESSLSALSNWPSVS